MLTLVYLWAAVTIFTVIWVNAEGTISTREYAKIGILSLLWPILIPGTLLLGAFEEYVLEDIKTKVSKTFLNLKRRFT